jgi:hypothetical protein
VAVAVEGDRDLFVAEHLADDLRVRPSRQLEGRERVPQVMEADGCQAGPPEQRLEGEGRDVPTPQRFAGRVTEDEIVVGHGMAIREQALLLPRPVGT